MVHMQYSVEYAQYRKATKTKQQKSDEKNIVIIMKYSKTRYKNSIIRDTMWNISRKCILKKIQQQATHRFDSTSKRVRDMDCDLCVQQIEIVSIYRNVVNRGKGQTSEERRCDKAAKAKTIKQLSRLESVLNASTSKKKAIMTTKCLLQQNKSNNNNNKQFQINVCTFCVFDRITSTSYYIFWYRTNHAEPKSRNRTRKQRTHWTKNGRLLFDTKYTVGLRLFHVENRVWYDLGTSSISMGMAFLILILYVRIYLHEIVRLSRMENNRLDSIFSGCIFSLSLFLLSILCFLFWIVVLATKMMILVLVLILVVLFFSCWHFVTEGTIGFSSNT